jgi:nucleoside-diphosphate kinase
MSCLFIVYEDTIFLKLELLQFNRNRLLLHAHKTKIMATNRTFTMLKPDAVEKGYIGAILEKISASGFRIVAMKLTQMTTADAQSFYAIHSERPFFADLVEYMTRGPIVAAVLEKENAVDDFRTLIGATNPADAAEGTIRKMYAESISANAVHGSDSDDNAAIEAAFHFSGREQF